MNFILIALGSIPEIHTVLTVYKFATVAQEKN